jgi:teichoic acid transport system ATP-binding protein
LSELQSAQSPLVHTPSAITVDSLHVSYRVYQDSRPPTLKRFVAQRFQSRAPRLVTAVKGVSFELHQGESLGLIGHNGAGKTSLLKAMAGLLPIASGRVLSRSEPVMLGVGAALHPELSGRRNIVIGGTALGMSRREVADKTEEIVAFSGLGDFLDMPLRAYSSGMAARLRFAIATAVAPDILFVDEALGVGDQEFQERSKRRMSELLGQAGAIVFVSHSLQSVAELCSRVLWLDGGRVRMDGPTAEVLAAYQGGRPG